MIAAHMDKSKRGATFLAKNTPMTVRGELLDLIRSNPRKGQDSLFREFIALIDSNDEYRESVYRYFFTNAFDSIQKELRAEKSPSTLAASMATRLERQEAIAEGVKRTVNQLVLLMLTMPNGKAMRYCTGKEMGTFGAGYAKIAKRVGTKVVGQVLNEEEVRKLME